MWQLTGHSRAVGLLRQSLESGQLSHAYLFVGPAHVGKYTLALNLAQAVNCASADPPCQECAPCRRIAAAKHADVNVVDLLSVEKKEIGIRQVAEMQTAAHLPPFEGRYKVFIFDRAEMLSHEAANSLLKTLEEPPPQVLIILLTARESALLPTIASRCQRVELRPLPAATVREALMADHHVAPDRADLLARLSGGCPGWAALALRDEGVLAEREERLAVFSRLCDAGTHDRLAYAADLAGMFSKGRDRVADTLSAWLLWWRDVMLIKCGNSRWIINADQEEVLRHQAERNTPGSIRTFMHAISKTARELEQNANARLALEVLLLNMP
jgi:DNA polymerase-3 subunit delta'